MNLIESFSKDPYTFIEKSNKNDIIKIIDIANKKYRNSSELLISDAEYDLLIDELKKRDPTNIILSKIGDDVHSKDKVKLPFFMGSMDKIKPNTGDLDKWKNKFKGNYVLSDKLDGTSALLVMKSDGKNSLYTRGNGIYGTNITSMLIGINGIPNIKENLVVRGELLISKLKYSKYSSKYSNSRAMINGLVNKKSINSSELKLIDFVAYELVSPWSKISNQFKVLERFKFNLVNYKLVNNISEKSLSEYLKLRKKESKYDIDGIIVIDNNEHSRNKSKNPKYAFAYKDILEDQIVETEVLFVEWNISKDGYIKPRIHLKPVNVAGIIIKHVTGNNAKYIKDNGIGKGTKIKIIRSGDVIPKIFEVLVKKKPDFPDFKYVWNETGVDIMINLNKINKNQEYDVLVKNLTYFFKKMNIKYVDEAIIKKMIDIKLDSINKIILASIDDFLEIDGFKEKMATKIYNNIQNSIKDVELSTLMVASNIFGHGLGEKKLKLIIDKYPDIFSNKYTVDKLIEMIIKIDGFEKKSATKFTEGYEKFKKFLKDNKKIKYKISQKSIKKSNGLFLDKKVVFSGFRDKELEKFITNEGGVISSSVSSNTNYLLTNDKSLESTKIKDAKKYKIPILLKEEFILKYKSK